MEWQMILKELVKAFGVIGLLGGLLRGVLILGDKSLLAQIAT